LSGSLGHERDQRAKTHRHLAPAAELGDDVTVTDGASSLPEVRRLLATLVASKPSGRIAEIGTAFGDASRAMAAMLGAEATFVSVELDPDRHAQAREAVAGLRVELVQGRWEDVLPNRGQFDLIFFDGGMSEAGLQAAIAMLAPGGILIKDDMTPGRAVEGDPVREALLRDDRLVGVEILTTPEAAAIVAVRRS
jgi:predicted O-methyltransferase YrrM